MSEALDVIVVGAGQAGLAMGYHLKRVGLKSMILDADHEIGASWRGRWESLRLFTPAQYAGLPGMSFPSAADTYPSKDQVADYLKRYADHFDLPVQLRKRVLALEPEGDGHRLACEAEAFHVKQVVVATGPFQKPFVPGFAADLGDDVFQLHSSEYHDASSLPPGEVLVVGGGNSGTQIAVELAATRKVYLSRGRVLPTVPPRIFGRSLFWWLETLGVAKVPARSRLGRFLRNHEETVIGERPTELLRSGRIEMLTRALAANGSTVEFADGRELQVTTVIWATGYRPDFGWIHLPVLDESGWPVHERGVTEFAGLYFLGLPWLHTTGSALIGWVGRDAKYLATRIAQRARLTSEDRAT